MAGLDPPLDLPLEGLQPQKILRADSPFFSAIALFNNQIRFPWVSGGVLERRIPGKNGEGTLRKVHFEVPRILGLSSNLTSMGSAKESL